MQLLSSLEQKSRRWVSRRDVSLMLRGEMGLTVVLGRRVGRGREMMQPISCIATRARTCVQAWAKMGWVS